MILKRSVGALFLCIFLDLQAYNLPIITTEGVNCMQEISSVKRKVDQRFNILLLQTVTVGLVLLFAIGIRIFGGDVYTKLSLLYHEKFDDITRASEVLEPENTVSDVTSDVTTSTEAPSNETEITSSVDSTVEDSGEEYDPVIDEGLSGHILDYNSAETEAVAANVNTLQWPVTGRISSHYGYRVNPVTGVYSMHNGLDIAANTGTKISAAYDGVVTSAGYSNSDGYYVIVTHNQSLQTLYAHCSKLKVNKGDTVKKGDTVGLVGSTGRSTGPHLHFEVRVSNYRIDPEWLLSELRDV